MKLILALAGMLLTATPAFSSTNWSDIHRVEKQIEAIGARVYWSKSRSGTCSRQGLLGRYRLSDRTVVICQANIRAYKQPLIETLQHEGWHAVQEICNGGRAVLTDGKIRALLSSEDKRTLRAHYDAGQHRLEAEARALERIPVTAYLRGLNYYCS